MQQLLTSLLFKLKSNEPWIHLVGREAKKRIDDQHRRQVVELCEVFEVHVYVPL